MTERDLPGDAGETDEAYYHRLFIQCGTWLEQYKDAKPVAQAKLVEIGTPALAYLVPTYLGSDDIRFRVTLEEIINAVGPPAVPTLVKYVADPKPALRQRIAGLLGGLDHPESLPVLRSRLGVEDDLIVLPALLDGIGRRGVGVADLVEPLAGYLDHGDERLRRNAAVALGRVGVAAGAGHLINGVVDDALFSVRYPARDAIWNILAADSAQIDGRGIRWEDANTQAGQGILLELDVALRLLGTTDHGWVDERLAGYQEPWQKAAVLRGVLRAWLKDHPRVDPITPLFTDRYDDPTVEAVGREMNRVMVATLLAEAKATAAAAGG